VRRFPVGWLVAIFAIVMVVLGLFLYHGTEVWRSLGVHKTIVAPSEMYAKLTMRYDNPPIFEEEYSMQDIEGISTWSYRIRGYAGKQITITVPPRRTYDVPFFIEQLELYGIWALNDKPPRGDSSVHYTLYIKRVNDYRQGDRTIVFTDPQYWAKAAGRQYSIHLSKNKPTPDLLHLQSSSLADPRYLKIVNEFRNFGPSSFREKVAAAHASILKGQ
jgi:hypothetical protein